jgi:hypothetical protein
MNDQTRALFAAILALPPDQLGAIMDALHEAEEQAFVAELERRRAEVQNGTADTIPWEQLRDELLRDER